MSKDRVEIWTDGSSLGNPGPGGWGALLRFWDEEGSEHRLELSQGYQKTTNNRMELLAAIAALEALQRPCAVVLWSDSQYLVRAHTDRWIEGWQKRGWKTASKKPVANVDLWQRLIVAEEPHDITYRWVRAHVGTALNERVDELARTAAQADELSFDSGFVEGLEN